MPQFGRTARTPPTPSRLSCLTCRWSDYRVGDDGNTFIECKRNPPVPVSLNGEMLVVWPQVSVEDYCGEWTKK